MKDKFKELTELWFNKAREDLRWAKTSLNAGFFAGACFIYQQAAEKSLKAYLFSKKQSLIKTHILPRLLKKCLEFDKDFIALKEACEILTLYYTEARYPDDVDTSDFDTEQKAQEALKLAAEILNLVKTKL